MPALHAVRPAPPGRAQVPDWLGCFRAEESPARRPVLQGPRGWPWPAVVVSRFSAPAQGPPCSLDYAPLRVRAVELQAAGPLLAARAAGWQLAARIHSRRPDRGQGARGFRWWREALPRRRSLAPPRFPRQHLQLAHAACRGSSTPQGGPKGAVPR